MPDSPSDRRDLVPQGRPLPEVGWTKQAIAVRGPFAALAFGIRAAANVRAMQVAIAHARVYGQLLDVAAETMGKIQKASRCGPRICGPARAGQRAARQRNC